MSAYVMQYFLATQPTSWIMLLSLSTTIMLLAKEYLVNHPPLRAGALAILTLSCAGWRLSRLETDYFLLKNKIEKQGYVIGEVVDRSRCTSNPERSKYTIEISNDIVHNAQMVVLGCRLRLGEKIRLKIKNVTLSNRRTFRQGFIGYAYCRHTDIVKQWPAKLPHPIIYAWQKWARKIRNQVVFSLQAGRGLYLSIFLGENFWPECRVLREPFLHWGITHYLARSGLHIVLLCALWLWILSLLGISLRTRYTVMLIASWLYFALSMPALSFVRAQMLFTFLCLGQIFYLPFSYLHSLCLVALGSLIYNPFLLFAIDFQLTFGLVFALIVCNKLVSEETPKK